MHDMKEFNYKPFDKGFSYESPITYHIREIYDKQMAERENAITIRVSECIGVDVNREELIKALNYDRQQYEKGYADAKAEYKPKECDDCVSRQAVKNGMIKYGFHASDMTVTEFVEDLPPVLPKREQGEWIEKEHYFEKCWAECSVCKKTASGHSKDTGWGFEYSYTDYCPNCGAEMR